jgi:hypothetical protein
MPSSSEKQERFMSAIAHDKEFAKKAGVSQSVGKEFHEADKSRSNGTPQDAAKKKKSRLGRLYK